MRLQTDCRNITKVELATDRGSGHWRSLARVISALFPIAGEFGSFAKLIFHPQISKIDTDYFSCIPGILT
jgi:hypothetical protein